MLKYSGCVYRYWSRSKRSWCKNAWGHIVHLGIARNFRFSAVPKQASPLHTAALFRACILNTVGLPTIDIFKGYTDRHPAFASFLFASALFLEERISTHFKTPNRLRKPPILLNRVLLYLPFYRTSSLFWCSWLKSSIVSASPLSTRPAFRKLRFTSHLNK